MTNLELAQQQGNQAAPNLLAAATAGELGGGGSVFPSFSTAGFVYADMSFSLSSDQADEAAANTIYANCKLVTDNHLDLFELAEEYTDRPEGSETSRYVYFAFSERTLTRIKNLAELVSEVPAEFFEILDAIEPDELCTFDSDEIAITLLDTLAMMSAMYSIGELPPYASGIIDLAFEQQPTGSLIPVVPVPEGSSVYFQGIFPAGTIPASAPNSIAFSYYAESLLDVPVKLDKTYYTVNA